jgi:hypothetical protein
MVCKPSTLKWQRKSPVEFIECWLITTPLSARKAYYELHNIGYCARPKHTYSKRKWYQRAKTHPDNPDGFIRQGQFKKASNMNYCLDFSIRVEDELLRLIATVCAEAGRSQDDLTVEEENILYQKALETIIDQDEGRTWAAGNVRIGEVILIIDSDTRVVCVVSSMKT